MALIWLLQIAEPLPIDGDVRLLRTGLIAEELLAQNHEVVFFSGRFDHSQKRQRIGDRIEAVGPMYKIVLLRGPRYRANLSLWRIINHISTALDFLIAASALPKPDRILISYPSPELAFTGALYAKARRVPYTVDYRDAWPEIFTEYTPSLKRHLLRPLVGLYSLLRRFCLTDADHIYVTSKEMGQLVDRLLVKCGSIARSSLCYLAYKSVRCKVNHERGTDNSTETPLRVIFVGTLGHSYNIDRLIDIARRLQVSAPEKFQFVIVGDGERRREFEAQSATISSVSFLGWLSQTSLERELGGAHIGALFIQGGTASYTVPNKFAEYLAYGLPVASDLQGEVAQIIAEASAGYTIGVDGNDGMERWLLSLLQSPDRLRQLRDNARKLFENFFDSAEVYRRLAREIAVGAPRKARIGSSIDDDCQGKVINS